MNNCPSNVTTCVWLTIRRSSEGSSSQEELAPLADSPNPVRDCSPEAQSEIEPKPLNEIEDEDPVSQGDRTNRSAPDKGRIDTDSSSESDEMKRAHAKQLIEQYFFMLSNGCGDANCANLNCASSGNVDKLPPNEAAARAIQLYKDDAPICGTSSTKLSRKSGQTASAEDSEHAHARDDSNRSDEIGSR